MKVIVVPHTPAWAEQFKEEARKLQVQIGFVLHHIHHIGSTSVPDLMAKPIIDILLDVRDLEQLDKYSYQLENLGYEAMGEFGIEGRRYFRKGGDNRTHQIHAFLNGDSHLLRHLAFRDYLITHKTIADEYGQLKLQLAKTCNHNIEKYCDGKDDFIKHHEALAIKWYKNTLT